MAGIEPDVALGLPDVGAPSSTGRMGGIGPIRVLKGRWTIVVAAFVTGFGLITNLKGQRYERLLR